MSTAIIVISIVVVIICAIIFTPSRKLEPNKEYLENKRKKFYESFGQFTSELIYGKYVDGGLILSDIEGNRIQLRGVEYKISAILECYPHFEGSQAQTTYTKKQVIEPNTGSVIGRAVVGGVLAGRTGAVIGATTAKKELKTVRMPHYSLSPEINFVVIKIDKLNDLIVISVNSPEEVHKIIDYIESVRKQYRAKQDEIKNARQESIRNKDLDLFETGMSKDEVLILDPNLQYRTENRIIMSRNFCKALSDKIGIKDDISVECHILNTKVFYIIISASDKDSNKTYNNIKIILNYYIKKYGAPKNEDFDICNDTEKKKNCTWETPERRMSLNYRTLQRPDYQRYSFYFSMTHSQPL